MTIDRRSFLYAGGMTAAAAPFATAAQAAPALGGRSVTDFGVEPNADRDQTEALQKAIDELSRAGQVVSIPGGRFLVDTLELPKTCLIIGAPGITVLKSRGEAIVLAGAANASLTVSGIIFERPQLSKTGVAAIEVSGGTVNIDHSSFVGKSGTCISLKNCSGSIRQIEIGDAIHNGIVALQAAGLSITNCRVSGCQGAAITAQGVRDKVAGIAIRDNQIAECAVGIMAEGSGIVSGNIIASAKSFGMKLGSAKGSGHILAQSNLIRDCRIGIAVSSSGDDIMASLNMISGAKDGAIRAFDGDKLVGPDLARQSAEAYLNLMVAGNVVR
jgi:Pectate lyase superfamily protein